MTAEGSLSVVGLTGGIASGKSTVQTLLGRLGAVTVDADKFGHRCYEPGTACYKDVVALFGSEIVAADGQIDRKKLGPIVFGSEEKMKQLSATTWPHIKRMIAECLDEHRKSSTKVVVVEAAVMIEAGWEDLFDEIWVAYVKPEIALKRLMARNSLSEEDASKRMAKQLSNEEKLAKANIKIENAGTTSDLEKAVRSEWEKFRERMEKAGKPVPPLFGQVACIRPDSKGLNLMMKVVKKEEVSDRGYTSGWDVVAGDASGVVRLRLSLDSHAQLCEAGASIEVQNADVSMSAVPGHVSVVLSKGSVLKTADSALDLNVNHEKDVSATEYELTS